MNGWQLLEVAQSEFPTLPVILVTGQGEEQAPASYVSGSFRCLIRKPFNGRELVTAIDTILRSGA
jgi:DNA-binding response OmpR family regulator